MTLRELMEKRAALVAKMRKINDAPGGESGDLSEAQQKEFTELRSDLEKADKAIERQSLIDEADRRIQGEVITGDPDNDFDRECRSFSLTRAIAGAAGLDIDDGREREVSAELKRRSAGKFKGVAVPMQIFEKRVLTTAAPVGGPGGKIIAQDYRGDQYIDLLRSKLVTQARGATVLSGLQGNVTIPKGTKSAVAGWVAENGAISASDLEFDSLDMTPKHVGALTEYSRNMAQQASPDVENLIRNDFSAVLARALDLAALVGGGSNEPDGLIAAGIDDSVSMATPSWSAVLDLINQVEEADAMGTGFVMRPLVAKKLRSTPKVDSTDSVMIMESPDELAGYPVSRSTQVPIDATPDPDTTSIIFGQWSDLLIGYWSAFDLLVNPYESSAYAKGNIMVRGMLTADVAVRRLQSFAASTDFPAA